MKFPFRKKIEKNDPDFHLPESPPALKASDASTSLIDKWELRDIVDLEYLLRADDGQDEDSLVRRDRAIFLNLPPLSNKRQKSRRFLIRQWLEARKKQEQDPTLPGSAFHETLVLLKWLVFISGLLSGGGLALSLLQYQGVQPVNVSSYVALLVVSQVFLLILLGFGFCLRRFSRFFRRKTFIASFWGTLLFSLARKMATGAANRLESRRKSRLQATLGLLKSRRSVYGSLFFLPIFLLAQLFGLAFNLGALTTTLARVLTSDLAFGWQTTLEAGTETVHQLVRILALPWSWLAPEGTGFPTLVQIENSRILLKEGIAHLATPDLVSWWPFLCLGIVFYGILPRFMLCLTTWMIRRVKLARFDFSHAECDTLVRRMQTPLLETTRPEQETDRDENYVFDTANNAVEFLPSEITPAVALVKEELADRIPREDMLRVGRAYFAMDVDEIFSIGGLLNQEQQVLENLKNRDWEGRHDGALLILEAWQPPILETLDFFRQLRMALPEKGKIAVFLVGKPKADTVFTTPGKIDRQVWEEQLQALGDPNLGIASPRKGACPHE
ncbi:MAG: DUF2868 domain-containing protein [Deltaproteobacteria bacterium]|nr:DUF2868 domain-containing protein [Deltaproteobacteria bacterium]